MRQEYSADRYEAMLSALFVRFPSVQQVPMGTAYKPGLDRMLELDGLLGYPHRSYDVIHVAGTNGKGSVSNLLASALASTGLRVGLYTSPHILDFRERMRIAVRDESGCVRTELISREEVYAFVSEWEETFNRLDLSFFEITTAMAFQWFRDSRVDVAVIETGLGGRLDSTNIVRPVLSIVTSIGLDHCDLLGNTLEEIAAEKAGIFKAGIPALAGVKDPHTEPVFRARARAVGAPLTFACESEPRLWASREEILSGMDLGGEYQRENLRTVLCALDLLRDRYAGLSNDPEVMDALKHTASRMDFHGRWERLASHPEVIADIGHNAHALRHNFRQLEAMCAGGRPLVIVYGVMADKDLDAILPLMPAAATYVFASPDTRRALPSGQLLAHCRAWRQERGLPADRLFDGGSVAEAVRMAMRLASEGISAGNRANPPLVYIGGSTFVVAEAIPLFAGSHPAGG